MILRQYQHARQRFRQSCRERGMRLDSVPLPYHRGPDGEVLSVDIAWAGATNPRKAFLCTSGMHGLEGPAGSAAQAAWLAQWDGRLPDNTGLCLVHTLNPWGFAYRARGTENNVDLNRNFTRFDEPLPVNPYYQHIRDAIRLPSLTPQDLPKLIETYERLVGELGPAKFSVAVNAGQYEDAEGLAFGGAGIEHGHRAVSEHVLPALRETEALHFIDWHTGVGAYGEVAFLPNGKPGTHAYAACASMWGEAAIAKWARSATEAAIEADEALTGTNTDKSGQLRHWLGGELGKAKVAGAVIEFGTERPQDIDKLVLCTLYDRWLRFENRTARTATDHRWALDLHADLFVPRDPAWEDLVLTRGPELMTQALEALQQ